MVGAVVLAAGAGRRMGGEGKALLDVGGVSFLERVIRTCREGGCEVIWVTVRPGEEEVVRMVHSLGCKLVVNPDPERGMFSSVHLGIQQALQDDPAPEGVLVFPVDHPRVRTETVKSILNALPDKPDGTFVQPTFKERGGHPIALDAGGARSLIAQDPARVFRDALGSVGLRAHPVPVADPHIRENLNTPDDLCGS